MTQAPASAHPYASLSLAQMIGLNLARLYAWLVRFEASRQNEIPSDIAQMVYSTDALVHAFIRMLASNQLERAGFSTAARAMRDSVINRGSRPMEQAALSPLYANPRFARANKNTEGAAGPSARGIPASTLKERAQGCTPAELIKRLEKTIDQFEHAEEIASALARIILLTLLYVLPDVGRFSRIAAVNRFYEKLASREQKREAVNLANRPQIKPMATGPPHLSSWILAWPVLDPGSPPGKAGLHTPRPAHSFPGARKRIRDPVKKYIGIGSVRQSPTGRRTNVRRSVERVLCEACLARTGIGEPLRGVRSN